MALSKQLYEFVDGKIQAMDRSMRAFDNELARTRQQLNLPPQEGSADQYAPSVGIATGWGPLLQEVCALYSSCILNLAQSARGSPIASPSSRLAM